MREVSGRYVFYPPYPPHRQDQISRLPTLTHAYRVLPTLTGSYRLAWSPPPLPKGVCPRAGVHVHVGVDVCARVAHAHLRALVCMPMCTEYLDARAQTSTRPRAHAHLHVRLQPLLHVDNTCAHANHGSQAFASFTAYTYSCTHHTCTRRRVRVNALLQGPLPLLLAPDHTSSDLWNPEPWMHTFISCSRRNGA